MKLWNKIRSAFGRRVEADLAEEMRLHREMLEERFRGEGMTAGAARARASREFGPAASALEDSRAQWSFAWLESVWIDARYALRGLSRSRAFTLTAVLTLGIGLGLASVALTLFNAYVLKPFAVPDPGSLYEIRWAGIGRLANYLPWQEYEALRMRHDVFDGVVATRSLAVTAGARHWQGTLVSGNYFRVTGGRVAMGRPIDETDARDAGAGNVVVLGHGAWKSAFGADPSVLGKKLVLRGVTFEVIGVAGAEFVGLQESPPDFWAPIGMHAAFKKELLSVLPVGRLRHDMSKAQAEAALGALARQHDPEMRADLVPRSTVWTFTPKMLLFFSPVIFALGLVLSTCCANVANMLLARGLARQREVGVRIALGVGRARLLRQLLTEALVIAGLAGLLGLLLAHLALDAGQRLFYSTVAPEFARVARWHSVAIDLRVFLLTLSAAALAAMGAAILPALQSTRVNLVPALRGETGGVRSSRLRDALVVAQVVVCVVLLVCGALLYRRASVFQARDTGMRSRGIVDVNLSGRRGEVAAHLRTLPEIEAVAVASRAPWYGRLDQASVTPGGHEHSTVADFNLVSPEYFGLFRIPLRAGRGFTAEEARSSAPVAVISEATARQFWPGEDPIGKTIRPERVEDRGLRILSPHAQVQVIGVAGDVIHGWIFDGVDQTCIYLPVSAESAAARNLMTAVRGDEARGVENLRRILLDRWPETEADTFPMSAVLALQVYPFRAAAGLAWLLGTVAMALSVSGMYGVMSYLVNQRSKEIGIRMALGSTPQGAVSLMMRRSLWLTGVGLAAGAGAASAAVKLLLWWSQGASMSLLAWDGTALAAGSAIAGVAATVAALGPARRAARVDPNTVLRAD